MLISSQEIVSFVFSGLGWAGEQLWKQCFLRCGVASERLSGVKLLFNQEIHCAVHRP